MGNRIQTTVYFLDVNINILYKDSFLYKNYAYYKACNNTEETINLLFVSNNHFQILYKRNLNNNDIKEENINNDKENIDNFFKEQ